MKEIVLYQTNTNSKTMREQANLTKTRIQEVIGKEFPFWSDMGIETVSIGLVRDFLSDYEGNFDILESAVNDSIEEIKRTYSEPDQTEGLLRVAARRKTKRLMQKFTGNFAIEEFSEVGGNVIGALTAMFSVQKNDIDTELKIQRFAKSILASKALSGNEEMLFKIIIEVVNNDEPFMSQRANGKVWRNIDFWNEVRTVLNERGIFVDVNKLKQRLRDRMNNKAGDSREMLQLVPSELKESQLEIKTFLDLIDTHNPFSRHFLRAHRFSAIEMNGALGLIKLFNNCNFKADQLPEVYSDIDENIELAFPGLIDKSQNRDIDHPDYLGVYISMRDTANQEAFGENFPHGIFSEGIIILFKERIERFAIRHNIPADKVTYVVLMHEIGHWLSHSAETNEMWKIANNWNIGFGFPNLHTKEAFAQLIAYWACQIQGNDYLNVLTNNLTPKNSDRSINEANPYGKYWALKDKSNEEILQKLRGIRKYFLLKDEALIEFLNGTESDIDQWIKSKMSDSNETSLHFLIESSSIKWWKNLENQPEWESCSFLHDDPAINKGGGLINRFG